MTEYTLQLRLLSPTLAGSGVGSGAIIDADIVFDDVGIPFIPAKRIKGCLRDAAREVKDMFSICGIDPGQLDIETTFGEPGEKDSAPVYFSNLYIEHYEQNKEWLRYFLKSKEYSLISQDRIRKAFTEIRQQTRIGLDGVAFEHSLRTSRILKKNIVFQGDVQISDDNERIPNTLLLSCLNFRCFGANRNRGFGEVSCSLFQEGHKLSVNEKLEALCTD